MYPNQQQYLQSPQNSQAQRVGLPVQGGHPFQAGQPIGQSNPYYVQSNQRVYSGNQPAYPGMAQGHQVPVQGTHPVQYPPRAVGASTHGYPNQIGHPIQNQGAGQPIYQQSGQHQPQYVQRNPVQRAHPQVQVSQPAQPISQYPVNQIHQPQYRQESTLPIQELEKRLVNLLIAIQEGEKEIESARQKLCQNTEFVPNSIFQVLDSDNDGVISSVEICKFLKDQNCKNIDQKDCQELVEYFGGKGNKVLTQNEFAQFLLPGEDNVLRNATLDRDLPDDKLDTIPNDIAQCIALVFDQEIRFAKRLDSLKREALVYGHSPLNLYRCVDKTHTSVIDTVNLGKFFEDNGKTINDKELLTIIRRLDTNGDATINLSEWTEFLKVRNLQLIQHVQPARTVYNPAHIKVSPRPTQTQQFNFVQQQPVHHQPVQVHQKPQPHQMMGTQNEVGYHYEYPVRHVEYEQVTRMETMPVARQVQVPSTTYQQKEITETVQVPVTRTELKTETRTEMIPVVTGHEEKEIKYKEKVPTTVMEEKMVTTYEMVPVTKMERQEVTRMEQVPVTQYLTQEFTKIESVPITTMQQQETTHQVEVPITEMQSQQVVTGYQQVPINTMETQEIVEQQQIERTEYVAVEKTGMAYYGVTDYSRGQTLGTVPGDYRELGITQQSTLQYTNAINTNQHIVPGQYKVNSGITYQPQQQYLQTQGHVAPTNYQPVNQHVYSNLNRVSSTQTLPVNGTYNYPGQHVVPGQQMIHDQITQPGAQHPLTGRALAQQPYLQHGQGIPMQAGRSSNFSRANPSDLNRGRSITPNRDSGLTRDDNNGI